MKYGFLAGALLLATSAQAGEAITYRGIPLGITKDELRKLPIPDGEKSQGARMFCVGEGDVPATLHLPHLATQLISAGVSFCGYARRGPDDADYKVWGPEFGDLGAPPPIFLFVEEQGQKKLYRIEFRLPTADFDRAVRLLELRYDKPTIATSSIKTNAGISYQNVTAIWRFSDTSLAVQKFSSSITQMSVSFADQHLVQIVADRMRDRDKAAATKM